MNDDETRRMRLDEGAREQEEERGGPDSLGFSLRKALLGAVFPLSTEQLVRLARENEAPASLLSLLGGLPSRRFDSQAAVRQALESRPGLEAESPEASPSELGPER